MEVPWDWSYKDYGNLSTESTWFHNLWTLIHYFEANITFCEEDTIQGLRESNPSLMSDFFCVGYRMKELFSLNIVHRFCNILHLSDISKCAGTTLDKFAVLDQLELSSRYVFPKEEPTATDFRIWKDAVHCLCSGTTMFPTRLGLYICPPHLPMSWYTTEDTRRLYRVGDDSATPSYCTYNIQQGRSTRHGSKYDWASSAVGNHPGMHYASVVMYDAICTVMNSNTPMVKPIPLPATFQERLDSFNNPSLWENLSYDSEGEWIREGLLCGLLCIAHDGSCMVEESTKHFLAEVIIYCKSSRQWLKSSIAESLEVASNYHGELLGAVIALLILRASSHNLTRPLPAITLFCNNRGVLSHGNNPYTALPEKQKQADLIRLIKLLSESSNITPTWEGVEGHAVERKGLQGSTLPKCLNNQANKLAKVALLSAMAGGLVMEGDFPFEVVKLKLLGQRGRGPS
jgi:hypothetical protein